MATVSHRYACRAHPPRRGPGEGERLTSTTLSTPLFFALTSRASPMLTGRGAGAIVPARTCACEMRAGLPGALCRDAGGGASAAWPGKKQMLRQS